ncbi:MAG TPA: GNAT family N-acetyltransferase [Verrucomicrobiae bacterium]|nr:GNAT family N-acetyltransferase [Verrucomicrobiae bacterium]
MIRVRAMAPQDVELGLRLKDQARWNQTEADWRRFLDLEPKGCFIAEWDGRPVATTTTCLLGTVGWIAMVLVDESARNRGIGTRLVEHAVTDLLTRGARTIRLDATPLGKPVYERLGFVADYELARMQGTTHAPRQADPAILRVKGPNIPALLRLDTATTGTQRDRLLARLVSEAPERTGLTQRDRRVTGYVMWRPGSHAATLGPAIATEPSDGVALLDWALGQCGGHAIFVDVPVGNRNAMDWALSQGLDFQRHFLRMHLGLPVKDRPDQIWASSGPEKG